MMLALIPKYKLISKTLYNFSIIETLFRHKLVDQQTIRRSNIFYRMDCSCSLLLSSLLALLVIKNSKDNPIKFVAISEEISSTDRSCNITKNC